MFKLRFRSIKLGYRKYDTDTHTSTLVIIFKMNVSVSDIHTFFSEVSVLDTLILVIAEKTVVVVVHD